MSMRKVGVVLVVVAVAVAMCGCGSRAAQQAAEGSASASVAQAAREQAFEACLDTWLNALAPQSTIDAGLKPYDDGQTTYPPVITVVNGRYHADPKARGITHLEDLGMPTADIEASIYFGHGCPYEDKQ